MNKAYKFKFELVQSERPGRPVIQLFGRDHKLTNDELEKMRRHLNTEHFPSYVAVLRLVNQATGAVVASSVNSTLERT
jgi:hypothetical protein